MEVMLLFLCRQWMDVILFWCMELACGKAAYKVKNAFLRIMY